MRTISSRPILAAELRAFAFRLACGLGLLAGLISGAGRVHTAQAWTVAAAYGRHVAIGLVAGALVGAIAGPLSAALLVRR